LARYLANSFISPLNVLSLSLLTLSIYLVESDLTAEAAYTYHILYTFAHVFHMRQRKVVSDNEWTGWLRVMKSCFKQGKIREYWESNLELEK
jgi:hypothetical protein